MKLWTWQADEIRPSVGDIDPRCPGSYYDTNPKFRPAFEKLWKKLDTDQLLWCFVDEEEAKEAREHWRGRSLWALDVPEDSILAFIDPGVWERLLGSGAVPPSYREVCYAWQEEWHKEAMRKDLGNVEYREQKLKEYHEMAPLRGDWWSELFLDGPKDIGWSSKWLSGILGHEKIVSQVLLERPVPESCVV